MLPFRALLVLLGLLMLVILSSVAYYLVGVAWESAERREGRKYCKTSNVGIMKSQAEGSNPKGIESVFEYAFTIADFTSSLTPVCTFLDINRCKHYR